MPFITLRNGARLSYGETGSGPRLILVHGSPADGRAWARVIKHLPADIRVLTPDLPGYGASDPLLPRAGHRTEAMAAAIGELIESCADRVWLCGYSYGGNVALHAALRHCKRVVGLALLEPVFMRALALAGERRVHLDTHAFFIAYLARVASAEPDAIGSVIDFWSGEGAYAKLPPSVKRFLNAAAAQNAEDVRAAFSEDITAAQLAAFHRPVSIVYGGATAAVALTIAHALTGLLPRAEASSIAGATHAMLDSHPQEVASIVDRFRGSGSSSRRVTAHSS
jgi:pimeloyl-ACP methyl ester carboxylesterase